jgi:hypothetical protein
VSASAKKYLLSYPYYQSSYTGGFSAGGGFEPVESSLGFTLINLPFSSNTKLPPSSPTYLIVAVIVVS